MLHVQLLKLLLILWYIHRQELVESLFTLLKCSQSGTWPSSASKSKMTKISGDEKEKSKTVNLDYVQQLILMALERVIALSHFQGGEQEVMAMDLDTVKVDITAVVQCVAEASDVALRNQALTLLTAISRVSPDLVLKHVIDILTAIGASTITQVKKLLSPFKLGLHTDLIHECVFFCYGFFYQFHLALSD
jgi:hypothetical protein